MFQCHMLNTVKRLNELTENDYTYKDLNNVRHVDIIVTSENGTTYT